jgi:hypothetical protein
MQLTIQPAVFFGFRRNGRLFENSPDIRSAVEDALLDPGAKAAAVAAITRETSTRNIIEDLQMVLSYYDSLRLPMLPLCLYYRVYIAVVTRHF